MNRARRRTIAALVAVLATAAVLAVDDDPEIPLFGPKLLYYWLRCDDSSGCRIDCYQNGANVISRLNLSSENIIALVVNTGITDEFTPRWIEIRSADGAAMQTILLTRDTLCDLQGLGIDNQDTERN